jgi:hypothetical protein
MEHKVTSLRLPVSERHVESAVNSSGRNWVLVSVSQSAPNEPMFLFWRRD